MRSPFVQFAILASSVCRFNRRRRPGGGGGRRNLHSERARYRSSDSPVREASDGARGRHGSRHRDSKFSDNFSDLWVRIDDSQDR